MYDRWMVKLFENINHKLARLSSDITGHSMFLAGFNFFVIWLFEQLTVFSLKWQNSCSKRCMFYFRRSSHISQEAKHPWQQKKHDKKKLVETPLLQNCKAMKPFRDRTITCSIFCFGEEKKESWSQKLLKGCWKALFLRQSSFPLSGEVHTRCSSDSRKRRTSRRCFWGCTWLRIWMMVPEINTSSETWSNKTSDRNEKIFIWNKIHKRTKQKV